MGKSCCVAGCGSKYEKGCGITFYEIPAVYRWKGAKGEAMLDQTERRRAKWLENLNLPGVENRKTAFVCSLHFCGGKGQVNIIQFKVSSSLLFSFPQANQLHWMTKVTLIGFLPCTWEM